MTHPTYEIHKNAASEYQFLLRSGNGRIILTGRYADTILACRVAINSCRTVGYCDNFYERVQAENGQFFYHLLARNGVVVGYSEPYHTMAERDQLIELCKRETLIAGMVGPAKYLIFIS